MTESQRQIKFLQGMMEYSDSQSCRELQEKLEQAQQDENCVRRTMFWLVVLIFLSIAGLAYAVMFLPEFSRYHLPLLIKFFCVVGLGACICLCAVSLFWCWQRALLRNLRNEGCNLVRAMFKAQMISGHTPPNTITADWNQEQPSSSADSCITQKAA